MLLFDFCTEYFSSVVVSSVAMCGCVFFNCGRILALDVEVSIRVFCGLRKQPHGAPSRSISEQKNRTSSRGTVEDISSM